MWGISRLCAQISAPGHRQFRLKTVVSSVYNPGSGRGAEQACPRLSVQEGADPNFRNKEGKCALDIALELEQASQRPADVHMSDDGAPVSSDSPLATRASATAQSVALVLQDKDLQFCNCTVRRAGCISCWDLGDYVTDSILRTAFLIVSKLGL